MNAALFLLLWTDAHYATVLMNDAAGQRFYTRRVALPAVLHPALFHNTTDVETSLYSRPVQFGGTATCWEPAHKTIQQTSIANYFLAEISGFATLKYDD